ncbi:hypothetical protein SOVF_202540 [Spinacia oleracea]|nr:hypothetical protein SOVF_202540 [Spinacia oleracea]
MVRVGWVIVPDDYVQVRGRTMIYGHSPLQAEGMEILHGLKAVVGINISTIKIHMDSALLGAVLKT